MKPKIPRIIHILIAVIITVMVSGSICRAEELLRIRVENHTGGLIEVSTDQKTYKAIGKVLRPASRCVEGFSASVYVDNGTVAATAVHGIRIKTGEAAPERVWESRKPLMISLVPFEFAAIPKGFGGHIPLDSGIYTDIPTGKSIFRNLAPYVGNKVYIQRKTGIEPLPLNYSPSIGDVIVISVTRPDKRLKEIEFENKKQGKVTAVYTDGRMEQVAVVEKPVLGVGRYDGTSYTGRGRINTCHPGVLTISTAPVSSSGLEGQGSETRGGFQIIPNYHAKFQQAIIPQTMVVGNGPANGPVLEGKEPLFSGYIGLSWDTVNDKHSFTTQVRIDGGDWEAVPEMIGRIDNAFTAEGLNEYFRSKGVPRDSVKGVTHIRIVFPSDDKEFILAEARKAAGAFTVAKAIISGDGGAVRTVSGNYVMSAPMGDLPRGSVVMFFIDGQMRKISSVAPHQYDWDTKNENDGIHVVDVRAADSSGNIVKTATIKIAVKNN